eukprot:COSAG02_NODE_726_length_18005_cov_69.224897_3_plen_106_part_00
MVRANDPTDSRAVCCAKCVFGATYTFEDQREVGLCPHPLDVIPCDGGAQAVHKWLESYPIADLGRGHALVLSAADCSYPCAIAKGTPVDQQQPDRSSDTFAENNE